MGDTIARIFEYRVLYAKHRELQIPLTHEEQRRMADLRSRLPAHVPTLDERDPITLLEHALPAQFVADGRFGSGVLRNGSAIGLAVETIDEPPPLGQRLILHVQHPTRGHEYTFPVRVIARVLKGVPAMGVVFDGVPSETRTLVHTSGVFRPEPDFEEEELDTTKVSRL